MVRCHVTALAVWCLVVGSGSAAELAVAPAAVQLHGAFARTQLVVRQAPVTERAADLTHAASYASSDPKVVMVAPGGRLIATGNGTATVSITAGTATTSVPVTVAGVEAEPQVDFLNEVMPVMSKAGCNQGACHAAQYGKGGLKVSVFGSDPGADWQNIIRNEAGRRVNLRDPDASLFLLKPTLGVPHEGGRRLDRSSPDYNLLHRWLAAGAPGPDAKSAKVNGLTLEPARRVGAVGLTQQIRVVASYSDGTTRDVTSWSRFDAMDDGVVAADAHGLIRTVGKGQGSVLVRFENEARIATFVVPYADTIDLIGWKDQNFIDTHAAAKFREVGITPSPVCDDATFLRRAYLDAIGTIPTPDQAKAFLDSTDPNKRTKLVDELLGLTGDPQRDIHNNAYASWWTLKWADLLRVNSKTVGDQGMWAMSNWLKASFRENKRFDQFVRELLTAEGSTYSNGPANFYKIASNPTDLAETAPQLFMGVRLQCARCHHHPFEKFSEDDYYGFAAFFARFGVKVSQESGLFNREPVILVRETGEVSNPRTRKVMVPTPLHGDPITEPGADRRAALADWLTKPDNKFFAKNVVNRYFAYLMGKGLVEPIDDLRDTNPPSNAELFDALSADFVKSGYDLKHLLRTIMTSRLYSLSSQPTAENAADSRFYSHYTAKRVGAEALLDAIDAATGVPTKYPKLPAGTRAIDLPDAEYNIYFLKAFGKPKRASTCECERVSDPNLAQALQALNGDTIATKLATGSGRVAQLLKGKPSLDQLVTDLYLAALSRRPSPVELTACQSLRRQSPDEKTFAEDLLWSLMNSKQFLFVR
jgi:hypothetical protein